VVEGWHGEPWGKPLTKTREYVEIVRAALRREQLEHAGEHYEIPYRGDGATGLGKPLKLMMRPLRADIPIYLASLRPKSVQLAVEIADGWLPIFYSPERARATFPAPFARDGLEIAPSVPAVLSDDAESARESLKPYYALYVGGMGARGTNFYNDLACAYGFEDDARRIQDLFLDGKHREAAAAVPDTLVDEMALAGPREHIAERLDAWRESGATELLVSCRDAATLRAVAELAL
jgi:F420-dependent oxidoreductase-like protein